MKSKYIAIIILLSACNLKYGNVYISHKSKYVNETIVVDSTYKYIYKYNTDLNSYDSERSGSLIKYKNKYWFKTNWVVDTFTVYEYTQANLVNNQSYAIDTTKIALSRNNKTSNRIKNKQSLSFSLEGKIIGKLNKNNKNVLLFKDSVVKIMIKEFDSVVAKEWVSLKPGKILKFIDIGIYDYELHSLRVIGPRSIIIKLQYIGSDRKTLKRNIRPRYKIWD